MNSLDNIVTKMLTVYSNRFMFYGLFASEINRRFSDEIPTACIWKKDKLSPVEILFGNKFWEECKTNEEKLFVVLHEVMHFVNGHLTAEYKSMMPDKMLANIAMDLVINECILDSNKGINETNQHITPPGDKKNFCFLENYSELNLKRDETSLYYYEKLKKAQEKKEKSKEKGEDSLSGMKGEGTSGCKKFDQDMDSQVDWHESWESIMEGLSDAEKEVFQREMESRIKRVAEETIKQRGTLPHNIKGIMDNFKVNKPVTSWKEVFKRFVGSALTTDTYNTRKRPNARFEDAPVARNKTKTKIVVGCDSSGSVSDGELHEFFSEIFHMYKSGVAIDVVMWDAEVFLGKLASLHSNM